MFNKDEIKQNLTIDDIYVLLQEWGGEPLKTSFGIVSHTICHNPPGEGSRKLYYYENSHLFRCYTGCDSTFDIFELYIKISKIQKNIDYTLGHALNYIANYFGFSQSKEDRVDNVLEDWEILKQYERIQEINCNSNDIILKEYDNSIINHMNYNIKIAPWLNEGITQEVIDKNKIGYYLGGDQITIPHYDKDGRFIGLRGRTMCKDEAEAYGKYRPLSINGTLYTHPLGMNLYNFNNSKENIVKMKKAIIYESEKSCLLYQSYFGFENDISVACCGSSISTYQIQLLLDCGVEEIIIGFDRQFQEIGDKEFKLLKTKLLRIRERYKNFVSVSFLFDKEKITGYKDSPIDCGPDTFLKLFKERIIL